MSKSVGKILVIRGGAIGDFILTLPVLAALRQQFPGIPIEVLGYPHIVNLARAGGLADSVHSIEAGALAGFFARNGSLDERLQEFFGGFAIIISYLFDPDEIFHSNVARCSRAQFIAGPHRPIETEPIHATEVFLHPLERLAIFQPDSEPRLNLAAVSKRPVKTLAAHPGSGSARCKRVTGPIRWCWHCLPICKDYRLRSTNLCRLKTPPSTRTFAKALVACRLSQIWAQSSACWLRLSKIIN